MLATMNFVMLMWSVRLGTCQISPATSLDHPYAADTSTTRAMHSFGLHSTNFCTVVKQTHGVCILPHESDRACLLHIGICQISKLHCSMARTHNRETICAKHGLSNPFIACKHACMLRCEANPSSLTITQKCISCNTLRQHVRNKFGFVSIKTYITAIKLLVLTLTLLRQSLCCCCHYCC